MFNILVVEDDKNLRKLITTYLQRNKYNTYEATNGEEALNVLDQSYIDLIVSDIMMPKMDGYELIKSLREAKYDVPILIITAKSEIEDKKEGFLLGADDYMVKPIDIEEMLLRIQVLLRRSKSASEKKIQIGDLLLNYNQLSVIKKDKVYNLAQKEFYLLYKLLSTPNTIFTRQELIEEVWGLRSEIIDKIWEWTGNDVNDNTVTVYLKRIREKMKDVDEFEIVTIRGIGYKAIIHEKG